MKGFKKDGKFRPTEKKSKSSLNKKDAGSKFFRIEINNTNNGFKGEKIVKAKSEDFIKKHPDKFVGKGVKITGVDANTYAGLKTLDEVAKKQQERHGYTVEDGVRIYNRNKESMDKPKMTFGQFLKSGNYLGSEVKERAKKGSPHFFDDDTMRFFSSRLTDLMWEKDDDIYFVTSEENKGFGEFKGTPRAYTVRIIDKNGDINEVGKFQEHETLNDARREIKRVLEGDED